MLSDLPLGGSFLLGPAATRTPGATPVEAVSKPLAPVSSGLRMLGSAMKVATARTMTITAAPIVQPISSRVLPRICAATAPLRARNFHSE